MHGRSVCPDRPGPWYGFLVRDFKNNEHSNPDQITDQTETSQFDPVPNLVRNSIILRNSGPIQKHLNSVWSGIRSGLSGPWTWSVRLVRLSLCVWFFCGKCSFSWKVTCDHSDFDRPWDRGIGAFRYFSVEIQPWTILHGDFIDTRKILQITI